MGVAKTFACMEIGTLTLGARNCHSVESDQKSHLTFRFLRLVYMEAFGMPNDGRTTSSKKDVVQKGRLHGGDSACRTTSQKSKYLIFWHVECRHVAGFVF
jgi:hypothetical protein